MSMGEAEGQGTSQTGMPARPAAGEGDATSTEPAALEALVREAYESLAAGFGTDDLERLAPCSEQVDPLSAVDLLEAGAAMGDGATIDELYRIFGRFEFETSALVHALAGGNGAAARALLAHGADLSAKVADLGLADDTSEARAKRRHAYLYEHLSDGARLQAAGSTVSRNAGTVAGYAYQLAVTDSAETTIAAIARDGLLCARDLKGLMLAAGAAERVELADALAQAGAVNDESVMLEVSRGGVRKLVMLRGLGDLLHPGCGERCVRFVCKWAPQEAARQWSGRFLQGDPEVVRAMVPYLEPAKVRNKEGLTCLLARNGYDAELEVMAGWPDAFTPAGLARAAQEASAAGHMETAAWLLDRKAALAADGHADEDVTGLLL